MKKHLIIGLLALFLVPSVASAYSCKVSQSPGEPDKCTQLVKIATDEATLVSSGMVLVHDLSASTTKGVASTVELADASAENVIVAGITPIDRVSGDSATIVVRGKTSVILKGNITAGDPLYASSTEGSVSGVSSTGREIGFALETGSDEEIDAYITIV